MSLTLGTIVIEENLKYRIRHGILIKLEMSKAYEIEGEPVVEIIVKRISPLIHLK
jgi:hypothetical protein